MKDRNRTNTKQNVNKKKTGAKRPSKAVSGNKFIQYPEGNNVVHQQPSGKKNLRDTRQDNQKKGRKIIRKQRNQRILTTVILVTILLAICIFISLKVLFIVRNVEVEGTQRYTAEEITAFCAIPMEENVFKIDTATLEEKLPLEFTYVEKADVQVKLPDKILISITDSVPTYYGEKYEGDLCTYTIYSQNFKTLTAQAAAPEGLVGISADLENEENRSQLMKIIEKLKQSGYDKVTKIIIDTDNNISIIYDNSIQVDLGTILDIDYKLKMSYHILLNELSETDVGIIDSTQAGSAVFQPKDG